MNRFSIVLLFTLIPTATIRAEEDEWVGQWVLPRSKNTLILDRNDKVLIKWSETPGKVTWVGKEWIYIRHNQYPGPYEGHVRKTDVVNLDDAPQYFTDKIQTNAKDTWALSRRGEAWFLRNYYDQAIEDLTEAIRLGPSPTTYIQRGTAWYSYYEFDKAIMDFGEAIRLDPKNAHAFNSRGKTWNDKQEYEKAIKDFDAAIRINPKYSQAFHNRGGVWYTDEEYDRAIKDYTEAIRLDPTDAETFVRRGSAWYAKKEFDKAIKDFSEAIRLDPVNTDAFLYRGRTWSIKEELNKAIEDYSEVIRIEPHHRDAIVIRGFAWYWKKEYDKALEDFNRAIRLNPGPVFIDAYIGRAKVWYAKKEYGKAIKEFDEATISRPKNADLIANLAWVLATCPRGRYRDGKRAVELATKACELTQWKEVMTIDTLATTYAEAGDFEKAIKFEKQAIEGLTKEQDKKIGDDYRARLKLFEDKKPYHEPEKKE